MCLSCSACSRTLLGCTPQENPCVLRSSCILSTLAIGVLEGNWRQLGLQLYGSVVCVVWSVVATYVLLKMIDATLGLRVCIDDELLGLDMVSVLLLASQVPHSLALATASPSLPPSLSLSLSLSLRRSARPQSAGGKLPPRLGRV